MLHMDSNFIFIYEFKRLTNNQKQKNNPIPEINMQ